MTNRKPTRYITGFGPNIVSSPDLHYHSHEGFTYSRLYALNNRDLDVDNDLDLKNYLSLDGTGASVSQANGAIVVPGGVNFIQAELSPSGTFPWHRTDSVDFVTVVKGQVELEVRGKNGDTKTLLREGDSVVQRMTVHRWINPSADESARLIVTTVSCRSSGDRDDRMYLML